MSRKRKVEPKRTVLINGTEKQLQLSRVTQLNTTKQFIHLDELSDGTWRICYTSNTIPDFSKVKSLEILRED